MPSKKRGQVATEHLAIAGFAVLVLVVILVVFYQYSTTSQDKTTISQAEKIVNTLTGRADELYSYNVGVIDELKLEFPENVENVYIGKVEVEDQQVSSENEIVLKVKLSNGKETSIVGTSEAKLQGGLKSLDGLRLINIGTISDAVCITSLSEEKEKDPTVETLFDICPGTFVCYRNGILEPDEFCDDSNTADPSDDQFPSSIDYNKDGVVDCLDFGFTGGTLSCTNYCYVDTSKCKGREELPEVTYVYLNDRLLSRILIDDTTEYYQLDSFKNVRDMFDISGNPTGGRDYFPFGEMIGVITAIDNFNFQSMELEQESNLYRDNEQVYVTGSGRYLTPQNSLIYTSGQSMNPYIFKSNNPYRDVGIKKLSNIMPDFGTVSEAPTTQFSAPKKAQVMPSFTPSNDMLSFKNQKRTNIPIVGLGGFDEVVKKTITVTDVESYLADEWVEKTEKFTNTFLRPFTKEYTLTPEKRGLMVTVGNFLSGGEVDVNTLTKFNHLLAEQSGLGLKSIEIRGAGGDFTRMTVTPEGLKLADQRWQNLKLPCVPTFDNLNCIGSNEKIVLIYSGTEEVGTVTEMTVAELEQRWKERTIERSGVIEETIHHPALEKAVMVANAYSIITNVQNIYKDISFIAKGGRKYI